MLKDLIVKEVPMINALCHREALEHMIDELDQKYTKKVMKRLKKLNNKDLEQKTKEGRQADIAEAYSPPRMTAMAKKLGLSPGFSLDLTELNQDGEPWDLSVKKMQDEGVLTQDEYDARRADMLKEQQQDEQQPHPSTSTRRRRSGSSTSSRVE